MGLRIHKMLGYGLTDVSVTKSSIDDARFNPSGIVCLPYAEQKRYSINGYAKFLLKKLPKNPLDGDVEQQTRNFEVQAELIGIREDKKTHCLPNNIGYCLVHNAEYGLSNVFCIVPLCTYKTWHRYDDTIDYYEERDRFAKDGGAYVRVFEDGLYPYNSLYWNKETGETIRNWISYRQLINNGCKDQSAIDAIAQMLITGSLGKTDNWQEMIGKIGPIVPEHIRLFCEYLEIFTNPVTWQSLKPIMYTYWS